MPTLVSTQEQLTAGLLRSLQLVVDPRTQRGKRYPLVDVLAITVLGCMCGCDNAEALEDWGRKEASWLGGFLNLPHGPPGQDVFLRVLGAMDPEQFRSAFLSWVRLRSMARQIEEAGMLQ